LGHPTPAVRPKKKKKKKKKKTDRVSPASSSLSARRREKKEIEDPKKNAAKRDFLAWTLKGTGKKKEWLGPFLGWKGEKKGEKGGGKKIPTTLKPPPIPPKKKESRKGLGPWSRPLLLPRPTEDS